MKKKAAICFLLCFCMVLAIIPHYSNVHAENEIILLAINNSVIRPLVNSIMPVRIDDSIYMPYKMLSNLNTIKYYYNGDTGQLIIYDSLKRITFDFANNRAYDDSGLSYTQVAKQIGESIYIPFDVVCKYFGIYCSLTEYTDIAPLFRINEGELIANDEEFSKQLSILLKSTYDTYISSGQNDIPIFPDTPDTPIFDKKFGYILFEGIDPAAVLAMGSDAVFFLTAEDINSNSDLIRHAIAKGQEIGLMLEYNSYLSLEDQFKSMNQLLNLKGCYTAHLVMIKEGSAYADRDSINSLISSGARLWDGNITIDLESENAIQKLTEDISAITSASVITLKASPATINAMPDLYSALSSIHISLQEVETWTTPINQINDIR